jgi:hypothetical protein
MNGQALDGWDRGVSISGVEGSEALLTEGWGKNISALRAC